MAILPDAVMRTVKRLGRMPWWWWGLAGLSTAAALALYARWVLEEEAKDALGQDAEGEEVKDHDPRWRSTLQ